jgi:hypothetical protein
VTTITWDVGSLADGASATMHLVVRVTAQAGSIMNTATATDASYDPTGQVKTASALASVDEAVIVPTVPTGEPWSGAGYWLIATVLSVGGVAIIESSRRRRRRYEPTGET